MAAFVKVMLGEEVVEVPLEEVSSWTMAVSGALQ